MRTPWRFLADLISRRPPSTAVSDAASNVQALEYHPVDDGAPVSKSESAAPEQPETATKEPTGLVEAGETSAGSTVVAEQAPGSLDDDLRSSVAFAGDVIALDTLHHPAEDTTAALSEPAKISDRPKGESTADGSLNPGAADARSSTTPENPFRDMLRLDAEIRDLRAQLARKLSLQNGQLRQMLRRYDRN